MRLNSFIKMSCLGPAVHALPVEAAPSVFPVGLTISDLTEASNAPIVLGAFDGESHLAEIGGRVFLFTSKGEIVREYLNPCFGDTEFRNGKRARGNWVSRAQPVPADRLPVRGPPAPKSVPEKSVPEKSVPKTDLSQFRTPEAN
ncbi:hypothetical protein GGD83_003734 [Rhodoblastus sphagnicola]|nr:hypothetical protein [Rhodoblastus sphagnicola]MBB4199910.1 hypothetical protein [Rhodoblastus sphagnicola]